MNQSTLNSSWKQHIPSGWLLVSTLHKIQLSSACLALVCFTMTTFRTIPHQTSQSIVRYLSLLTSPAPRPYLSPSGLFITFSTQASPPVQHKVKYRGKWLCHSQNSTTANIIAIHYVLIYQVCYNCSPMSK